MPSGRKPGYKHSDETKQKISESLTGRTISAEHRSSIASARSELGIDAKCAIRLKELRSDYPDQGEFFDQNESDLLFAMRDVRTEKELSDITRKHEVASLASLRESQRAYQYASSSYFATEDAMIELLDFKRLLQRYH